MLIGAEMIYEVLGQQCVQVRNNTAVLSSTEFGWIVERNYEEHPTGSIPKVLHCNLNVNKSRTLEKKKQSRYSPLNIKIPQLERSCEMKNL